MSAARQEIAKAVDRLDRALTKRFKPRGKTPEARITAAVPKLPRRMRRHARDLLAASQRVRATPGAPVPAIKPLLKGVDKVVRHSGTPGRREKKARRKARNSWVIGVLLNLAIGAVLFAAFIYIGEGGGL